MVNSVGLYGLNNIKNSGLSNNPHFGNSSSADNRQPLLNFFPVKKDNISSINAPRTRLTSKEEIETYNSLLHAFSTSETEKISPLDNVSRQVKLDALLKNGVLLNNDSNDKSTVLQNLSKTLNEERTEGFNNEKIAGQIIDTLYNPAVITQKFGDIPKEAEVYITNKDKDGNYIQGKNNSIDVQGSGTCVAASVEFHMANKHPAEFARWAEGLTSPQMSVKKDVDLSALSTNPMNAIWLLKEFDVKPEKMDFYQAQLNLKPDKNAIVRAQVQDNYWDKGERSMLDVLFQSTLMQLGSQQSYDTLTDTREGKFNSNPQGLIEFEKTFIESVVENNERTSVVYQNVDNNQNLLGWNCDLDIIQKHITDTIDSGEDVVAGYVLTAKECNEPSDNPNKIVNGHEITIVDYKKAPNGKLTFICNDTDDNKEHYVEYTADYLLPKIHHAGYPVKIVEQTPVSDVQAA